MKNKLLKKIKKEWAPVEQPFSAGVKTVKRIKVIPHDLNFISKEISELISTTKKWEPLKLDTEKSIKFISKFNMEPKETIDIIFITRKYGRKRMRAQAINDNTIELLYIENYKENKNIVKTIIEKIGNFSKDDYIKLKNDPEYAEYMELDSGKAFNRDEETRRKLKNLNKIIDNKLNKHKDRLPDIEIKNILDALDSILKKESKTKLKRKLKEFIVKNTLVEFNIPDNQIMNANKDLADFANSLTSYNNINLTQIKSILGRYGLKLISDGKEVEETSITLTDTENVKSYSVGSNTNTKQGGENEPHYLSSDNTKLNIRKNKNSDGSESISISLSLLS